MKIYLQIDDLILLRVFYYEYESTNMSLHILIGNKEKQRYMDKSICLLATRFSLFPISFYVIHI